MKATNWHRVAGDMERARDNALAQLAYEQANRRQQEADYRAEHEDYLRQVESERAELLDIVNAVRDQMLDWERRHRMGERTKIDLFWAANAIRAALGAQALEAVGLTPANPEPMEAP